MPLLEKEAVRFAESLDDYEHVSVADIGGSDHSHWVVVRDHRFGLEYEITSHCDYWNFIGAGQSPPVRVAEAAEGGGVTKGPETHRADPVPLSGYAFRWVTGSASSGR